MDDEEVRQRLAELRRQYLTKDWELDPIRDRLRVLRAKALIDVTQARAKDGKPLYPSEKTREAAATIRLDEDPEYRDLVAERRRLDAELETINLEIAELLPRQTFQLF